MIKVWHRCLQELVEQMHFMFHKVVQRSFYELAVGEKYYIYFVDNLLLFRTVQEFSKSVNI